jgi:beta-aspartyl-dipeptidase (metallo-type)
VGGMLSKKTGVTHFHIGPTKRRMQCLFDLLECDKYAVEAKMLYPTHVERSSALMRDAIRLAKMGSYVDIDVQEGDLAKWVAFYMDNGGDLKKLTVSSDASKKGPDTFFDQIRRCARGHRLPLAKLLSLVTSNTAEVLGLKHKGRLETGREGDILVMEKDAFDLVHVLARGKAMVRDGHLVVREKFLEGSNRRVEMQGDEELIEDGVAESAADD